MRRLDLFPPGNILNPLWVVLLVLGLCINMAQPVEATSLTTSSQWEGMYFCKCICFQTNYTILPIYRPENPAKPCLTCTKQWCVDQKLPICIGADIGGTDPDTGTGKEGDVEGRCFQRDSPRDQVVVTLFLLVVFGLLLGAAIRGRMEKAGINFNAPGGVWRVAGSKWWEFFLPSRRPPSSAQHRDVGSRGILPISAGSSSQGYESLPADDPR